MPSPLESVCRKFGSDALLPKPPRELTRLWKSRNDFRVQSSLDDISSAVLFTPNFKDEFSVSPNSNAE